MDTGGEARVLSEKAVVKKGPCGVCVCGMVDMKLSAVEGLVWKTALRNNG